MQEFHEQQCSALVLLGRSAIGELNCHTTASKKKVTFKDTAARKT